MHLAGYSGGIGGSRTYPADFYFRNTILGALMFDAAARHKVRKSWFIRSAAAPIRPRPPIRLTRRSYGPASRNRSAPYSAAKMTGTVAAFYYRRNYGLDTSVIISGNMYGEYENFPLLDIHVVPAMIRRYHEAGLNGA